MFRFNHSQATGAQHLAKKHYNAGQVGASALGTHGVSDRVGVGYVRPAEFTMAPHVFDAWTGFYLPTRFLRNPGKQPAGGFRHPSRSGHRFACDSELAAPS